VSSVHFTSSDHASFFAHRIPTVGVSEEFVGGDRTPHYHTREDTYDKVDFAFLELATIVGVDAVVREIVR
jgi:Zn-dependent M28 family amino/carboxypeptidase